MLDLQKHSGTSNEIFIGAMVSVWTGTCTHEPGLFNIPNAHGIAGWARDTIWRPKKTHPPIDCVDVFLWQGSEAVARWTPRCKRDEKGTTAKPTMKICAHLWALTTCVQRSSRCETISWTMGKARNWRVALSITLRWVSNSEIWHARRLILINKFQNTICWFKSNYISLFKFHALRCKVHGGRPSPAHPWGFFLFFNFNSFFIINKIQHFFYFFRGRLWFSLNKIPPTTKGRNKK